MIWNNSNIIWVALLLTIYKCVEWKYDPITYRTGNDEQEKTKSNNEISKYKNTDTLFFTSSECYEMLTATKQNVDRHSTPFSKRKIDKT